MRGRPQPISPTVLHHAAAVIKCLGHPLRLRLLEAMERGERTVSELQALSGVSQATVSEQLGVLRGHGVVEARREGPFVYYRITEAKVCRILACIRECDAAPAGRTL
jgi:DNA-binding transcriptional ArsR family regulator